MSTMKVAWDFLLQNLLPAGITLPEFNIRVGSFLLYGSVLGEYSLLRIRLGKTRCLPMFKTNIPFSCFLNSSAI